MENNNDNKPTIENNLLDVRKAFNSKELIENITNTIKAGTIPALEGMVILKRMAKVSEEVMKDEEIKKMAMTELEKYSGELKGGKKSVDLYSSSMSISAVHTFYDFTQCGHEVLDQLYKIKAHCDEMIKQIEEEVKTIPSVETKSQLEFGIEHTGRDITFQKIPTLTWEDYGVIGNVQPPRKVQKIGIRFNKI